MFACTGGSKHGQNTVHRELMNFRVISADFQFQEMQCCNTIELTKPFPFQFTFYNVKEGLGRTTEERKPKLGRVFHARSGQKKHLTTQSTAFFIFIFMLFWISSKLPQLHVYKQLYSACYQSQVIFKDNFIFVCLVTFDSTGRELQWSG